VVQEPQSVRTPYIHVPFFKQRWFTAIVCIYLFSIADCSKLKQILVWCADCSSLKVPRYKDFMQGHLEPCAWCGMVCPPIVRINVGLRGVIVLCAANLQVAKYCILHIPPITAYSSHGLETPDQMQSPSNCTFALIMNLQVVLDQLQYAHNRLASALTARNLQPKRRTEIWM